MTEATFALGPGPSTVHEAQVGLAHRESTLLSLHTQWYQMVS